MLHNTPASLKKEYEWRREADSLVLANAQLQTAYRNFFRNKSVGFPRFRSKKSGRNSYTTNNQNGTVRIEDGKLRLAKIWFIRIKQYRNIPDDRSIKSVTVTQEASSKYYASILTEYEYEAAEMPVCMDNTLGLDYSSPHFYVDSEGNTADMPHFSREAEKKLATE